MIFLLTVSSKLVNYNGTKCKKWLPWFCWNLVLGEEIGKKKKKKGKRKGTHEWKGSDLKYYLYSKLQNSWYFWPEERRTSKRHRVTNRVT